MKNILIFIFIHLSGTLLAQIECPHYTTYIRKGDSLLRKQNFEGALKAFSIAQLHCPDNAREAQKGIIDAFNGIKVLKDTAIARQERAIKSEIRAINAELTSYADKFIYFAQEAVNFDPILSLHLAKLSLEFLDSRKEGGSYDSTIYDKAQRIYYENNFGETIIDPSTKQPIHGKLIQAIYARDDKSIWTLTDSAYAYQWDTNGNLTDSLKLDPTLDIYVFKQSGDGVIIIHGYKKNETKASGKTWLTTHKQPPISLPGTKRNVVKQIEYLPQRDTSQGWAERLFVFGNRAFSLDNNRQLTASISADSGSTTNMAVSSDGKKIAYNNLSNAITIIESDREHQAFSINTANPVESLSFSPDKTTLLVETNVFIRLYFQKIDNGQHVARFSYDEGPRISLFGYKINSYQFSSDGKRLLVSFGNTAIQIVQLYRINAGRNPSIELLAKYECHGSKLNSAAFSNNPKDSTIITSSDKIRKWKIPQNKTEPAPKMERHKKEPEFYVAVDFNEAENLFFGYTATGKKIKFKTDGTEFETAYTDSTYQSDSLEATIVSFLPGGSKVAVVSEDGDLNMYHEKPPMEAFLKTFRFEPFTEAQKRKYGIK